MNLLIKTSSKAGEGNQSMSFTLVAGFIFYYRVGFIGIFLFKTIVHACFGGGGSIIPLKSTQIL